MGNLLSWAVGKELIIEAEGISISGKLLRYQESDPKTHMPFVLILKTPEGMAILRAWDLLKIP
jgi:hypothetical protein